MAFYIILKEIKVGNFEIYYFFNFRGSNFLLEPKIDLRLVLINI